MKEIYVVEFGKDPKKEHIISGDAGNIESYDEKQKAFFNNGISTGEVVITIGTVELNRLSTDIREQLKSHYYNRLTQYALERKAIEARQQDKETRAAEGPTY